MSVSTPVGTQLHRPLKPLHYRSTSLHTHQRTTRGETSRRCPLLWISTGEEVSRNNTTASARIVSLGFLPSAHERALHQLNNTEARVGGVEDDVLTGSAHSQHVMSTQPRSSLTYRSFLVGTVITHTHTHVHSHRIRIDATRCVVNERYT